MFCTNCGKKLPDNVKFCTACGFPVAAKIQSSAVTLEEKRKKQVDEFRLDIDFDKESPESPASNAPDRNSAAAPSALHQTSGPRPVRPDRTPAPGPEAYRRNSGSGSGRGSGLLVVLLVVLVLIALTLIAFIIASLAGQKSASQNEAAAVSISDSASSTQSADLPDENVTEEVKDPAPEITSVPETEPAATPAPAAAEESPAVASPAAGTDASSAYLLPDSSTRYLTESDISSLTQQELCLARNEIFARHGRIFTTPEIAAYFEGKTWYHGTVSPDDFQDSVLNAYELSNIQLIKNYETKVYGGSYY